MTTLHTAPIETPVATPVEALAPWEAELDSFTDETILDLAKRQRTKRVHASTRRGLAPQSGESRAWTAAGNVD